MVRLGFARLGREELLTGQGHYPVRQDEVGRGKIGLD